MMEHFSAKSKSPGSEKEARICNTMLLHLARLEDKSVNTQMSSITAESCKRLNMCELFNSLLSISESI